MVKTCLCIEFLDPPLTTPLIMFYISYFGCLIMNMLNNLDCKYFKQTPNIWLVWIWMWHDVHVQSQTSPTSIFLLCDQPSHDMVALAYEFPHMHFVFIVHDQPCTYSFTNYTLSRGYCLCMDPRWPLWVRVEVLDLIRTTEFCPTKLAIVGPFQFNLALCVVNTIIFTRSYWVHLE